MDSQSVVLRELEGLLKKDFLRGLGLKGLVCALGFRVKGFRALGFRVLGCGFGAQGSFALVAFNDYTLFL